MTGIGANARPRVSSVTRDDGDAQEKGTPRAAKIASPFQ